MAEFNCRVFGIVVNSEQKTLLIKRSNVLWPESKEFRCWEYCGGGLEHGEDPQTAIIREYLEETGIVIRPVQLFQARTGFRDEKPLLNIGYICRYVSGEVILTAEHEDYRWVSREELKEIDFGPHGNLDVALYLSIAP